MTGPREIGPPRWPLKILRFFLKRKYLEEIEGDMEEIFQENVERLSVRKARQIYTWEMIRLLRPGLVRNLQAIENLNQISMFRNYFKISFRGLMKNPLNSFINVFGLAAAIGICIFAYAFTQWTLRTDQFHEHKDEVFLVTFFAERESTPQQYGQTPRPLGEMLRQDFAQVKKVCRIEDRNVVVKFNDNVFHERIRYTDPEFLQMFTFPLKWGTASSLKDINSIIISEPMSVKYFGDANPVGENIILKFDKERSKVFKVTGVAEEFPKSRTISFNFLINYENLRMETNYDAQDWRSFVNATLIQVDKPSDIKSIEPGMEKYRKVQNQAVKEEWAISSFAFEPLATLNKRSEYIKDDISRSSRDNYLSIMFMIGIAVFLLMLACFNYINIAIASAAKRLKEIGIRKSIGATRSVVIVQFLAENLVITFFALLIGLLLGMFFFIPGFEGLFNFNMDFRLNDLVLWIFLPSILLLTSIASGIYPSLYISRFQVVNILKGSVKFGQRNLTTKIFLSIQLVFACVFIITSVMFQQNGDYLSKRSWGYNQDEALYAVVPDRATFEQLQALVVQDANVQSVSGSAHHLGKRHATTIVHFPDRDYEVDQLAVDPKYFNTLGIEIKQGRSFEDHEGSDRNAVVVNEAMVNDLIQIIPDWSNPIGQQFRIDSVQYEVIGVVKDFHSYSFEKVIPPTMFSLANKEDYRFLTLKVSSGTEVESFKTLQARWLQLFPDTPFEGGHQEDVWGFYFEEMRIQALVWRVFAFIAVALATLGLYGLISLNISGRVKEFSIRKVLGAGIWHMINNVGNQYTILFSVAVLVGAPLGFLFAKAILEWAFPYHMPMGFSGMIVGSVILIFILLITISTQIRKVLRSNPVEGLKTE